MIGPSRACRVALLASTAAIPLSGLAGQDTALLPRDDELASVAAETVSVLSFQNLQVAPDALARVFLRPGGGFVVTSKVFAGPVVLFSDEGAYAGTIGRKGAGPDDFGGELMGASSGDKLWIADRANQRVVVLDSHMDIVAQRPLSGLVLALAPALSTSGVVASGLLTHGDVVASMAWISPGGNVERHGPTAASVADGNPRQRLNLSAEVPPDEVWSVAMVGGTLVIREMASLSRREVFDIGGGLSDLPPAGPLRIDRERPPSQVAGLLTDTDHVWIVAMVADSRWQPGLTPADGPHRFYDTLILQVDAERRRIDGIVRFDAVCLPIQGSLVSCVDEDREQIRILRLRPS